MQVLSLALHTVLTFVRHEEKSRQFNNNPKKAIPYRCWKQMLTLIIYAQK